jgi:hypothetical protein
MTLHPFTTSTSLGINALWAFQYPSLLNRSIDRLFEEWGNLATYDVQLYTQGEVRVTAKRNPNDERTPMLEVIRQKQIIRGFIDQWLDEFIAAYRVQPGNEWIVKKYTETRAEDMAAVAA